MKYLSSLHTISSLLLSLCIHINRLHQSLVIADRMLRVIFNDGIAPTTTNMCTDYDYSIIDPLFDIPTNVRRRRRQLSTSGILNQTSITITERDERELSQSARCKDNCAGYVPGTCRATGCASKDRRHLTNDDIKKDFADRNLKNQSRHRQTSAWISCHDQLNEIHTSIDDIITNTNLISQPCKSFLARSKRQSVCYDDIIYGEIESFRFLNMIGGRHYSRFVPTVLQSNVQNGFQFCSRIPVNIEVIVNRCVETTLFTITGGPSNNYVDYKRLDDNHPMYAFNTTTHASTYGGRYFQAGYYTLTATPDYMTFKAKRLDFQVIDCPY